MRYEVQIDDEAVAVEIETASDGSTTVRVNAEPFDGRVQLEADRILLIGDTRVTEVFVGREQVHASGRQGVVTSQSEREKARIAARGGSAGAGSGGDLHSPMPGRVVSLLVSTGDTVVAGQPLAVIEAMKMENELKASADGTVERIAVAEGDSVESNALLIAFEALD